MPTIRSLIVIASACAACGPASDLDASFGAQEDALPGGTFSGVVFDEAQAAAVVDEIDNATAAELDAVPSIGLTVAQNIIAARPYLSCAALQAPLARLDAVSGVGPVILTSLRDTAAKLWCAKNDGRQHCAGPVAVTASIVINEFAPGPRGWVDLLNTTTRPEDFTGWTLDDLGADAAASLDGLALRGGQRLVVEYGGISATAADGVVLRNSFGFVVDQQGNSYDGHTLDGSCLARLPDGGAFTGQRETCTRGAPNGGGGGTGTGGGTGGPTGCTGGTYRTVAFSAAEECRALDFLDRALLSEMGAFSDRPRLIAYEMGSDRAYDNHRAVWSSVADFANTSGISSTTVKTLKTASSTWTWSGRASDSVASIWAVRSTMVGKPVGLNRVYVVRELTQHQGDNGYDWTCAEVRDAPTARNYLYACVPTVACDTGDCWAGLAGTYRYVRGTVRRTPAAGFAGYRISAAQPQLAWAAP